MSVYSDYKPAGGGEYLRLKDGDKVAIRIGSEPAISVYKKGQKPRYSWVVWNWKDKKAQVYSSGISVFRQIADLEEGWGDVSTFDITIKRTGSGLNDTEYSVMPVKTSVELSKEALDEIGSVDLITAIKGKWLADYVDDGELPAPVTEDEDTNESEPLPEPPEE